MAATPVKNSKMPYVRLGKSGLKVSKIILGTMQYGSSEWQDWVIGEEDEIVKHVKAAYDAGINAFDTANTYSNGMSEVMLGRAIKRLQLPRDEIVVMTKVYRPVGRTPGGNVMGAANPDDIGFVNQHGLSRKHIFDSVKHSLERLQLDYIDLLQCHRFDYNTPIEETMQALHDVVQAGYVRYIGMSACWAYQFHAMQNYAIAHKLTPFISMQNHHSLLYREDERELLPTLKMFGVGSIPFSPLARGLLARPLYQETKRGATDNVEEIAKKKGISMAQVATAWSLSKDGVTAPIVGTTSLRNLEDIIGAVHVELTEEEIKYLEEPYVPQAVIGHT
ncbi:Aldo/keto reductase [Gloeophyllum trabeum ATCC 11539]|uniref:Aldo/keto reductase n=1 Tax=Gloeophyllum trabeum (strain ATCC 11539 / FP-39264 / Madison 617) TaxID=670483 RepID=S7RNR2_GLOTA|nr:Aldo/keto reductase [Gloeophyllum trabeum ATCC 11539]EPQ56150.1 Aldo/keto reductase [Gloeophyllum trabeum ATCC 11539]